MTESVLIERRFAGIGDWLFCLACMNLINEQRPDVELFVSWETPNEPLPALVPEAYGLSQVRYLDTGWREDSKRTGHVSYNMRGTDTFIESMLAMLNSRTGLGVRYVRRCPRFDVPPPRGWGDYVCMIGHGKTTRRTGKDPGFEYFEELARLLAKKVPVLQLGAETDRRLAAADTTLVGKGAETVIRALRGAKGFVGIENGLMVLAGFMAVPQLTLYNGTGYPNRVDFDNQLKIDRPRHPEEICRQALERFSSTPASAA